MYSVNFNLRPYYLLPLLFLNKKIVPVSGFSYPDTRSRSTSVTYVHTLISVLYNSYGTLVPEQPKSTIATLGARPNRGRRQSCSLPSLAFLP